MTVQSPSQAGSRKRRRGVVTPYDFRRPTTLAREHTRALEMAFETFARQWSTLLLTRLRSQTQVQLTGVVAQSYDEYVRSLPGAGVLVTFRPDAGGEQGLLQLTSATAMTWLDLLLGGGAAATPAGPDAVERELTEIERRLLADLVTRTLADLAYAFATVAPMSPVIGAIESSPQFLQLAAAADVVLVASLAVAVGEDAEGVPATMMLPLAPLLARLQEQGGDRARSEDAQRARRNAAAVLARSVPDLPVDVVARMSPLTMRPRQVVALSVGDVLHMPHPTARPLDVVTNDVVLARAVAGTSGNRLACLVVAQDEEKNR